MGGWVGGAGAMPACVPHLQPDSSGGGVVLCCGAWAGRRVGWRRAGADAHTPGYYGDSSPYQRAFPLAEMGINCHVSFKRACLLAMVC